MTSKTVAHVRADKRNAYDETPSNSGPERAKVEHDTPLGERAKRTLSDLVLAEVFFVQATIESAAALGDGFNALRAHFNASNDADAQASENLGALIERTRRGVVEPYSVRFSSLRKLLEDERAA